MIWARWVTTVSRPSRRHSEHTENGTAVVARVNADLAGELARYTSDG